MRFTVFTATYNRAYTLKKLYDSLTNQTYKDFEWVVVDDGSTDDTESLINSFVDENLIDITHIKTQNGGKHRAINKGVSVAKGEMFFIVDSDDELPTYSLEIIDSIEKSIPMDEKSNFCGVCGLKGYSIKHPVGSTFNGDTLDITSLERDMHCISGDKSEVFYTDILKKFPFPEFDNEIFLTEAVVWNAMAFEKYKLRFFNQIVYICDYLPDGLTANLSSKTIKSPKGHGHYLYTLNKFGVLSGVKKWISYYNYYLLFRKTLSISKIADNLHCNTVEFKVRILFMRIFFKFFD